MYMNFHKIWDSIERVLSVEFSDYIENSINIGLDSEFVAIVANLANAYAKRINYSYYEDKDILTEYLARYYKNAWSRGDGILYAETKFGQVSFHVFEGQDEIASKYGLAPDGREWEGTNAQDMCSELAVRMFSEYKIKKSNEIIRFFEKGGKVYKNY